MSISMRDIDLLFFSPYNTFVRIWYHGYAGLVDPPPFPEFLQNGYYLSLKSLYISLVNHMYLKVLCVCVEKFFF